MSGAGWSPCRSTPPWELWGAAAKARARAAERAAANAEARAAARGGARRDRPCGHRGPEGAHSFRGFLSRAPPSNRAQPRESNPPEPSPLLPQSQRWLKTSYRNLLHAAPPMGALSMYGCQARGVRASEAGIDCAGREKVPSQRCSRHGGNAWGRSYSRGSVLGTGRDRDL